MPNSLFIADQGFPKIEKTEDIQKVSDYLYMLLESLRYTLANIGRENMNEASYEEIKDDIQEPVIKSVRSITLTVEEGEGGTSSTIKLWRDGVEVKSDVIRLTGLVSFENLVEPNDRTIINGGNIKTGTISAIDINGCLYQCCFDRAGSGEAKYGGQIKFYEDEYTASHLRGGIRLDDEGTGGDAPKRMIIYTKDVGANTYALKIDSGADISIQGDKVYILGRGAGREIHIGDASTRVFIKGQEV